MILYGMAMDIYINLVSIVAYPTEDIPAMLVRKAILLWEFEKDQRT
jgi:hypothetical protein